MFARTIEDIITEKFDSGKAIIVVGARQVGKTTLLKKLLKDKDYLFLDADDPSTRNLLQHPTTEQIRTFLGAYKYVFLDEAQRIPEIGFIKTEQQVENRLLFGFYPEVINNQGKERETLKNLVNSYLYRDILAFSDIRKPEILEQLLQALALQMGSEVNYNELSQLIGINKITVQKYIDILEKGYIVFRLNSFSRILRNEIKKNRKIYFYDNGIRNMIIGDFKPLNLRLDKGALWENFLVSERRKQNIYKDTFAKMYFWRTKQQQEIDFVEEKEGRISAFEFKWNNKKTKFPQKFLNTYSADGFAVDRNNFREFVKIKN